MPSRSSKPARRSRPKRFGSNVRPDDTRSLVAEIMGRLNASQRKRDSLKSFDVEERQYEWGRIDAFADVLELLGHHVPDRDL